MSTTSEKSYLRAAAILRASVRNVAFTGAGISVESGIPSFRGENGLWARHDPAFLDTGYFRQHPGESWKKIKEIFYDFFGTAEPNEAHRWLADLESRGWIRSVITQNIDNLHQAAGSRSVVEFHGTSQTLVCTHCGARVQATSVDLDALPPSCSQCNSVLKPDFVFFGEPIPDQAHQRSLVETEQADVFLVIGTTGEIMPASMIPMLAKSKGAKIDSPVKTPFRPSCPPQKGSNRRLEGVKFGKQAFCDGIKIVEINIEPSRYTHDVTDVFLQDKANVAMRTLSDLLSANP
jgi:NAD-dependent deacetylase